MSNEHTSGMVATIAGRILAGEVYTDEMVKSLAASALTQAKDKEPGDDVIEGAFSRDDGVFEVYSGKAEFNVIEGDDQMPASIYEGGDDARVQTAPLSRFRPTYRTLTAREKALHDEIKAKAAELEVLFGRVKPGRYNSLAVTALEQSIMWVVKELTS